MLIWIKAISFKALMVLHKRQYKLKYTHVYLYLNHANSLTNNIHQTHIRKIHLHFLLKGDGTWGEEGGQFDISELWGVGLVSYHLFQRK